MEKVTDKLSRKLISGKKVMLAQVFLKKGCVVVSHSHESEQMTYILSGSLKLRLPDREVTLNEGDVLRSSQSSRHRSTRDR